MPDLIDYGLIRNAAKEAAHDLRGDLGRVGNDVQTLIQQLNQHSGHLANLKMQADQISNVQQQVQTLADQMHGLTAKIDQLNSALQNLNARLS